MSSVLSADFPMVDGEFIKSECFKLTSLLPKIIGDVVDTLLKMVMFANGVDAVKAFQLLQKSIELVATDASKIKCKVSRHGMSIVFDDIAHLLGMPEHRGIVFMIGGALDHNMCELFAIKVAEGVAGVLRVPQIVVLTDSQTSIDVIGGAGKEGSKMKELASLLPSRTNLVLEHVRSHCMKTSEITRRMETMEAFEEAGGMETDEFVERRKELVTIALNDVADSHAKSACKLRIGEVEAQFF